MRESPRGAPERAHAPDRVATDRVASYGEVTARFYDAAYAEHAQLGADLEFYRNLARESGGPVLEIGCGTGRALLPIAAEGIACTGLDSSRHMLDALRAKPGGASLRLVRGLMQRFDLGCRYRLVFSAFRAFQHLHGVDDQLACLACVRRHLEPGGAFAFDVFNPRLDRMWAEAEPEHEDLRFERAGEEVVRYARIERDRVAQVIHLFLRYERRRGGALVANECARFGMRWFTRFELEHLMARAGFADVQIFGDFDRAPVGRETPAYVVVAR